MRGYMGIFSNSFEKVKQVKKYIFVNNEGARWIKAEN